MLSTYKKWLKRELVKKGYWTTGVQAVGKRELEAFFRAFVKKSYSEYGHSINLFFKGRADWIGLTLAQQNWAYSVQFPKNSKPELAAPKIVAKTREVYPQ